MDKEEYYKLLDEFINHTYNPQCKIIAAKVEGLLNKDSKEVDSIEYKFIITYE